MIFNKLINFKIIFKIIINNIIFENLLYFNFSIKFIEININIFLIKFFYCIKNNSIIYFIINKIYINYILIHYY